MIELYAITDDARVPRPPVRAVSRAGLTVLYGAADDEQPTADALWRREQLIENLMRERDLLPVRFGAVVADEQAAARVLVERHDELCRSLERVRGAVEVAVRAQARETADPPTASHVSGRAYMQAKVRRAEAATLVHEPLARAARESAMRPGPELLRAAYLVERAVVPRFVRLVERLQRSHPTLEVICTGPWPPYSFADGRRG